MPGSLTNKPKILRDAFVVPDIILGAVKVNNRTVANKFRLRMQTRKSSVICMENILHENIADKFIFIN